MTDAKASDAADAIGLLDQHLEGLEFTNPVGLEDVTTVHEALLAILPAGIRLESYHRRTVVVFELRSGDRVVAHREKKVIES